MKAGGIMARFDKRFADRHKPTHADGHDQGSPDCWPGWVDAGDGDAAEESARANAPAIVFGEIGRVLLVILAAIAAIHVSLDVLHFS